MASRPHPCSTPRSGSCCSSGCCARSPATSRSRLTSTGRLAGQLHRGGAGRLQGQRVGHPGARRPRARGGQAVRQPGAYSSAWSTPWRSAARRAPDWKLALGRCLHAGRRHRRGRSGHCRPSARCASYPCSASSAIPPASGQYCATLPGPNDTYTDELARPSARPSTRTSTWAGCSCWRRPLSRLT